MTEILLSIPAPTNNYRQFGSSASIEQLDMYENNFNLVGMGMGGGNSHSNLGIN